MKFYQAIVVFILSLWVDVAAAEERRAVFAGGCFWCMEAEFEGLDGVSAVVSGYTGGVVENPTYAQVSAGKTGHVEAVEVVYDPAKVTYGRLLEIFWGNVDPTDAGGQFCDRGSQYAAGVFVMGEAERKLAEASKAKVEMVLKQKVAAFVRDAGVFYPAEEQHQDYHKREAARYERYKKGCGREERLEELGR